MRLNRADLHPPSQGAWIRPKKSVRSPEEVLCRQLRDGWVVLVVLLAIGGDRWLWRPRLTRGRVGSQGWLLCLQATQVHGLARDGRNSNRDSELAHVASLPSGHTGPLQHWDGRKIATAATKLVVVADGCPVWRCLLLSSVSCGKRKRKESQRSGFYAVCGPLLGDCKMLLMWPLGLGLAAGGLGGRGPLGSAARYGCTPVMPPNVS